jgi:hypothetical protein
MLFLAAALNARTRTRGNSAAVLWVSGVVLTTALYLAARARQEVRARSAPPPPAASSEPLPGVMHI